MAELTERERQLLADLERSLMADDPHFGSRISPFNRATEKRTVFILLALQVLVGFAAMVWAVAANLLVAGVLGFLVAVVGGVSFYRAWVPENAGANRVGRR